MKLMLVLLTMLSGCLTGPMTGKKYSIYWDYGYYNEVRESRARMNRPGLTDEMRNAIRNGQLMVGMIESEVLAIMSVNYRPHVYKTAYGYTLEHGRYYLHFTKNGMLYNWFSY